MGTNVYPWAAERNGSIKSLRARGGRRFKRLFFSFCFQSPVQEVVFFSFCFQSPVQEVVFFFFFVLFSESPLYPGHLKDGGWSGEVPTPGCLRASPPVRAAPPFRGLGRERARGRRGRTGGRTSRLFFFRVPTLPPAVAAALCLFCLLEGRRRPLGPKNSGNAAWVGCRYPAPRGSIMKGGMKGV